MTRFEYVAIFYGIVVALAIETVLVSVHRLLAARKRVRWHWMAPATAINSSLLTLGQFWVLWGDRDQWKGSFSFFQFLPFGISMLLMFLAAAATLPDRVPDGGVDLKEFYYENRRHYWGLVVVYFGFNILLNLSNLVMYGTNDVWWRNARWLAGDVIAVAIATPLIIFRRPWVHVVGIVLALMSLAAFLATIQL
jgi:hypothetical protein